jgi:hypothetical protein
MNGAGCERRPHADDGVEVVMRSLRGRLAAALIAIGVSGVPAQALEIPAFDQLSIHDKARYVALLLEQAKKFLTEAGYSSEAHKIGEAFSVTEWPSMPPGMRQLGNDLQTVRNLARKTGNALHVEHALLLTFAKRKIEGVGAEMMNFGHGFKPSFDGSK